MTSSPLATLQEFEALVSAIERQADYQRPAAWGIGLASFGPSGAVLDTYYPVPNLRENYQSAAVLSGAFGEGHGSRTLRLTHEAVAEAMRCFAPFANDGAEHPNIRALEMLSKLQPVPRTGPQAVRHPVATFIADLAERPVDAHDVYLRLHLLSQRKVAPHGLNLDGIFGLLNNVVWTNLGPFEPAGFEMARLELRARGIEIQVHGLDKFPRMTDYVVPTGVRIADANRVRLGAYLSEGTTVMHEGFVNFNAGTLGASMVEGRISAGVVVGHGSDVGGGASIMGTLSGGGTQVIQVGQGSLIGANAGIGISLGNGCTVEAGLYVTAGAPVKLPDGRVVKAIELSGQDDLLFRRHGQTGAIEVVSKKSQVVLNEALHANL